MHGRASSSPAKRRVLALVIRGIKLASRPRVGRAARRRKTTTFPTVPVTDRVQEPACGGIPPPRVLHPRGSEDGRRPIDRHDVRSARRTPRFVPTALSLIDPSAQPPQSG